MTKRRAMRLIYNILDILLIRKFVQKFALKMAILEIEDEN